MTKIKIIILMLFLLIVLLSLTGCGYGELKGIVVDKRHTEEYKTTSFMYNGKFYIPIIINHPEKWEIELYKKENGIDKKIVLDVSKEEYDKIQVGENYGT